MSRVYEFEEVGRLPMSGDNVAIAVRRLEAGTGVRFEGEVFRLERTVMEGHRFAVRPVAAGEELLSWELPFGRAMEAISPGMYVCNQGMLEALGERELDFTLPEAPNFADYIERHAVDEGNFRPGAPVEVYAETGTFNGYDRGLRHGVGTRNYVVIMGTSSRTASFARLLAARLQEVADGCPGVDGVVAVDHTEGGGRQTPNNEEFVLRTLAGFAVHPNVGALLAVDYGVEAVTNRMLREFMIARGYPLDEVPHGFASLSGRFEEHLESGERQVRQWLEMLAGARRSPQPLARLRIALQCGGSDAFSGISGNPLAGWVARETIRHGGAANLAETDELIGAEPYVLQNVRDLETAHRFLTMVERFKERVAWHGESAEGNPSGGNKYRGLYNIALKSIGAARKRDPEARLEHCIEYAEPMRVPGFHFMDSPGNDLESIAGQVASGCNMIFFVTGNGSVTNFPFVPTLKVVTTTARYELLADDMDVNAGAYQDGVPMDELGRRMFALTREVAGGALSRGERAGHSQVQIWRDWPQRDASQLESLRGRPMPAGRPLTVRAESRPEGGRAVLRTDGSSAAAHVGLVLPTSLCSGQVARLAAERLTARGVGREQGISRFVALVHTEGCGGSADVMYARTVLNYLIHPLVRCGLLLEHGCEKTHNDYMRNRLGEMGLDAAQFGWASVQLDGGIEKALERIEGWFRKKVEEGKVPAAEAVGSQELRLGLPSVGPVVPEAARAFARLVRRVVTAGGTVVVPEGTGLLGSADFADELLDGRPAEVCLAYGQRAVAPGFYVMEAPTEHWVETLTGLGATGVEVLLTHAGEHPLQGHPLVPLAQVSADAAVAGRYGDDLDLVLDGEADEWAGLLLELVCEVAARRRVPRAAEQRNTDFQMSRGLLGVSM